MVRRTRRCSKEEGEKKGCQKDVQNPKRSVVGYWDRESRYAERVQKGIAYWDKQNNDILAPNYMLKVREEIIKDKDYK